MPTPLYPEYHVLALLSTATEPQTAVRLSLRARESIYSGLLERMRDRGWIERVGDGWAITKLGRDHFANDWIHPDAKHPRAYPPRREH